MPRRPDRRIRLLAKLVAVLGPGKALDLLATAGTELADTAGRPLRWPRLRGLRAAAGVAAPGLIAPAPPPDRVG